MLFIDISPLTQLLPSDTQTAVWIPTLQRRYTIARPIRMALHRWPPEALRRRLPRSFPRREDRETVHAMRRSLPETGEAWCTGDRKRGRKNCSLPIELY